MVATGRPAGELLRELAREAQEAERAGFGMIWVPEHHQGPSGSLTDPITVVTWLLAQTSRISVGTCVLVAPLHHPVRLAEQAAILQEASGGRFVIGLGAGYQESDFAVFGRDRERRRQDLEETISVLRRAWAGEPIGGVRVAPRPAGAPPPIWMGAWSRWGVRTAARLAEGWIADPIRTEEEVAEMAGWYRAAALEAGVEPRIHLTRDLWVDADAERARRVYAPSIEPIYRYYLREGALGTGSGLAAEDMVLGGALDSRVVCGSPAEVRSRLQAFIQRTGAQGCGFALRHPAGPAHEEVLAAIRLMGAEVLPELQASLSAP